MSDRKFTTWEYRKAGRPLRKVEVRVQEQHSGRRTSTSFYVRIPELQLELRHKDVDQLRALVFAELDKRDEIKWVPWLHVTVEGDIDVMHDPDASDDALPKGNIRSSLRLHYDRVLLADDGDRKLSRGVNDDGEPEKCVFDRWPEVGEKKVHRGTYDNEKWKHEIAALVPDTEENRRALDAISTGMANLLQKLGSLLSPTRIEKTLLQIQKSGVPLLPAPE
jgi:hypothetical protein